MFHMFEQRWKEEDDALERERQRESTRRMLERYDREKFTVDKVGDRRKGDEFDKVYSIGSDIIELKLSESRENNTLVAEAYVNGKYLDGGGYHFNSKRRNDTISSKAYDYEEYKSVLMIHERYKNSRKR